MNIPTAKAYSMSGFTVSALHPFNQIFINNENVSTRIKGISAFKLMDLYSYGYEIDSFLNSFAGYNTVRVFCYTPAADWGDTAWDTPNPEKVASFLGLMAGMNWYVKLVLLTDDDDARIYPAVDLVNYLKPFKFTNLILAAGNEPLTHKNIDVNALTSALTNSGYLYTSGVYEDLKLFYGNCGDEHSGRDFEWPRKAKDVIECYRGGGPNFPDEPACKVPWILGEPIRPDQALNFGNEDFVVRDFYTYGALGSLAGAGVVFHSEAGKFCTIPNSFELRCANAMLTGMEVFPADAALGNYERIDEGADTLRTYIVGNYCVRVRPVENIGPLEGFTELDTLNVCYKRD